MHLISETSELRVLHTEQHQHQKGENWLYQNTMRNYQSHDEKQVGEKAQQANAGTDEDLERLDRDAMQRDSANDTVALTIFLFLFLFGCLFVFSTALIITFVIKFGVIEFTALSILCFIVLVGGWFLAKSIIEESKMQHAKKTILYWKEVAKAVIIEEIRRFKFEWKEHYLLTHEDCSESNEINERRDGNETNFVKELNRNIDKNVEKKPKEGKSILFRLVKPFLSKRKAASQRIKKDKKVTRANIAYDPPDVTSSLAAT